MTSTWTELSSSLTTQQIELPPALNAAVLIVQVLSTRMTAGLPIRDTQWATLASRVSEWRALLCDIRSREDSTTRTHLNVLTQLMQEILEAYCDGALVDVDAWRAMRPMVEAANEHLQKFPTRIRKGTGPRRSVRERVTVASRGA